MLESEEGDPGMEMKISKSIVVAVAAMLLTSSVSCGGRGAEGSIAHVKVEDITVGYKAMGSGPALVMITGLGATMDLWDPDVLDALSARYRVIVFDNRGMGETTAGVKPFSMPQFAQDAVGFIRALGLTRVHLLGWSMGTNIALELILMHPEMVEALVLYAGDCGGGEAIPPSQEVIDKMMSGDPVQILETLFPAEWLAEDDNLERMVELFGSISTEQSSEANKQRQFAAWEGWEGVCGAVGSIQSPVFLIAGDQDVSTPTENTYILKGLMPDAEVSVMDDGGHGVQYQYPADFSARVLGFLQSG